MKTILVNCLLLSFSFLCPLSAMDVEDQNSQKSDNKRKLEVVDRKELFLREHKRLKKDDTNLPNICYVLPTDVISITFSNLPFNDLLNMRLVCSYFKTSTLRADSDPCNQGSFRGKKYHYGWILFYPNLKKLDIMNNAQFGIKQLKGLGQWLMGNTSLQVLDIQQMGKISSKDDYWDIRRKGIGCEGAEYLAKGLERCISLTSLTLECDGIGTFGANCLVDMLKNNSSITFLNLGLNDFGDFGAIRMGELLSTNPPLKEVRLGYNSIGSRGIKYLAKSLEKNIHLTSLDLEANAIDDEGIRRLSDMLKENTTLTTLKLNNNPVTNAGCTYLAEMLQINCSLTKLDLRSHCIDDAGVQILQKSLEKNTSLKHLSLDDHNISYGLRYILRNLSPFSL